MQDMEQLGVYELATNHRPMPIESLLGKLSSSHSRRTYQRAITEYLAWIERDPLQAAARVIGNYRDELLEVMTPAKAIQRLAIIRRLYEEAREQGLVQTNPVAAVALPEASPDPSCSPPALDEAERVLPSCNRGTETGRRDFALSLLVKETGLPAEEIRALRVGDCSKGEGEETLSLRCSRAAGGGPLALSRDLSEALEAYLAGREVADDAPLFGFPRLRSPAGARS